MITLDHLNAHYKVVDTPPTDWPDDLSNAEPVDPLQGDCQTYGRTVKGIEGVEFPRAIMVRCWSPQNFRRFPFVPRHAVMFIWGKGFIDSTVRKYRWTPLPHIPAWPVGSLFVVAGVQIGEGMGWWPGLFALAFKVGVI